MKRIIPINKEPGYEWDVYGDGTYILVLQNDLKSWLPKPTFDTQFFKVQDNIIIPKSETLKTSIKSNIEIDTELGAEDKFLNEKGYFMRVPLSISHKDTTDKNAEPEFQHVTQEEKTGFHAHANKEYLDNYNPTLFATALQGEKADSALQSLPPNTVIDADYPTLKDKVNGIEENANNYIHPLQHSTKILSEVNPIAGNPEKYLNEQGDFKTPIISHSGVTNKNAEPNFQHITQAEKDLISSTATIVNGHTEDISELQTSKADKATTLSGYGITDAYTKAEIDNKVSAVYKFKGNVNTYADLPATNQVVGDVYNVNATGINYAWDGAEWDNIGGVEPLATSTNNGLISKEDFSKLAGIEAGAEVNNISDLNVTDLTDGGDTNIHYHSADRNRANHTGTQPASTISDFDTEVANNTTVSANTSARHTHNNKTVLDNTTASFTTTYQNKLDGIQEGAEANVNADWNAITGDAQILNKPTTISGYGITDSYTKNEIDTSFENHKTYSNVTREDLLVLVSNNELIPNSRYRITDYTTTTAQSDTVSAGHDFDIIVTALSTNELSEDAECIRKAGDTYFANAELESWEIKYCINNDVNRFAWADAVNGKGVIYYMKDEWGNECPYDFKNIQFKRYPILSMPNGLTSLVFNANTQKTKYALKDSDGVIVPTNAIIDENNASYYFTFNAILQDSVTYDIYDASIIQKGIKNSEGGDFIVQNNKINEAHTTFDYPYKYGQILKLNDIVINNIVNSLVYTSLSEGCHSNTFDNDCYYITFGNNCYSNTFSIKCDSNTFGNGCYYNTFGNGFDDNTFGFNCYSNTFGDKCDTNTFGDSSYYNTFGNGCDSNTFGSSCISNTLGNNCNYNTLENNCNYNTFDDSSNSNTFGIMCSYNTFGSYSNSNTFGIMCSYNKFGNYCSYNNFYAGTAGTEKKNYIRYVFLEEGCRWNNFYSSITTSPTSFLQRIRIKGLENTTPTDTQIELSTVNTKYEWLVCYTSSGVLKQYCPNDSLIHTDILYADLLALISNNELVPNSSYRITDYTTTTVQADTTSAGHDFDIIVTALSTNELSEIASCVRKSGDTYFANAKLGAWEIKYCINNDTTRFAWADIVNGKGVIYYMKDEWNNECPYDFKNIQFKKSEVFLYTLGGATDNSLTGGCHHNTMMAYKSSSVLTLNFNTFGTYCQSNSFGDYCYNNTLGNVCQSNTFGNRCFNNTIGNGCQSNTFGYSCNGNTFGANCMSNTFDNECTNNEFGENCSNNLFGSNCTNNLFELNCQTNSFGDFCQNNTFGTYCQRNTFGNNCYNNTFGTNCSSNTFGDNNNSNTFGDTCNTNTFGTACSNNIFGNVCKNNRFGNSCQSNEFGNNCSNNRFGNECYSNSFRDYCSINTFEDYFDSNTFGIGCWHNMFGNICTNNTLGDECSSNTFGNTCSNNNFYTGTSGTTKKNYLKYIVLEDGCVYNNFYSSITTSSSSYLQRIRIKGLENTTATDTQITLSATNTNYEWLICYTSSGVLKQYCPND